MKNREMFDTHPLWETIEQIQAREDLRDLETETRNYLKALLEHLQKRREHTNHYYVPQASLDRLQNQLNYAASNIPNSPRSVESYVDEAFNELSTSWPAMAGSRVVDISVSTFQALMNDISQEIEKAYKAVSIVEITKDAYAEEIRRLESNIAEYEESASKKIENIAAEAEESTRELNAQLARNIEDANKKATESKDSTEAKYISEMSAIEAQAQDLLDKVSNKASKISGKVIADSYGKYARNKGCSKWFYDVLAIVFAVIGIFLVGFALVGMHADETSATVYKTAVSLASFTISGFLFKRGTYEQREAKAAKRTELTLRQYESFIANLGDEEKDGITKDIADRVFIKGELDDTVPTISESIMQRKVSSSETKEIVELVQMIMKSNSGTTPPLN